MDYNEEQSMEIEALESILMDDLKSKMVVLLMHCRR